MWTGRELLIYKRLYKPYMLASGSIYMIVALFLKSTQIQVTSWKISRYTQKLYKIVKIYKNIS